MSSLKRFKMSSTESNGLHQMSFMVTILIRNKNQVDVTGRLTKSLNSQVENGSQPILKKLQIWRSLRLHLPSASK